ncbi:MAG TPA: TetR family transcriptional regulator [Solirubrobacteraceae bacterium]|jgi:AcrR family transcriptional regulator|nr:TetR family transcriptional regulator [Solirubrobacteraceae bacterium]
MSAPNRPAGARKRSGQEPVAPNRVAEIQRQRIIGAMAEVAAEKGAANVTVAHIVARAGISRRTFYEIFEDREACLLAALEEAIGQAAATVVPAYRGGGRPDFGAGWRERVRAGLAALLTFLEEEPGLGRLCVVEALGAGEGALERRAWCLGALIATVDEGRGEVSGAKQPPPMTAEGVVGAVFAIVHARILARDGAGGAGAGGAGGRGAPPLTSLLGELMAVIVLPYLGPSAAQKELRKPAPTPPQNRSRPRRDPLEGLDMRLTYRTVRVLMGIAGHPGASNRTVAHASGISDQGQISKLLARLESLGLAENTGRGHPKGAPNAWRLTARGQEVEGAIRLQTG